MLQGIGIVEMSNECEELVERMILFVLRNIFGMAVYYTYCNETKVG